jgi:hypothetical protein
MDETAFIAGATVGAAVAPEPEASRPYSVQPEVRVQMNVKLPQRLLLQIEQVAQETGAKKQFIIEKALTAWLRRELVRLGKASDDS